MVALYFSNSMMPEALGARDHPLVFAVTVVLLFRVLKSHEMSEAYLEQSKSRKHRLRSRHPLVVVALVLPLDL